MCGKETYSDKFYLTAGVGRYPNVLAFLGKQKMSTELVQLFVDLKSLGLLFGGVVPNNEFREEKPELLQDNFPRKLSDPEYQFLFKTLAKILENNNGNAEPSERNLRLREILLNFKNHLLTSELNKKVQRLLDSTSKVIQCGAIFR